MKTYFFLFTILLFRCSTPLWGQVTPQKQQNIKKIMEITEIYSNAEKMLPHATQGLKNTLIEDLSINDQKAFEADIKAYTQKELLDKISQLFDQELTLEESNEVLDGLEEKKSTSALDKVKKLFEEELAVIITEWTSGIPTKISVWSKKISPPKTVVSEENCRSFHSGEFQYKMPDGSVSTVTRTKTEQIEVYQGESIILDVKWLDSCTYQLKFKSSTLKSITQASSNMLLQCHITNIQGDNIIVQVKDITNQKEYTIKFEKINPKE